MTIIFTFPLEQGKENDAPFIISSLVSFQSTRDKKCHLTHFSPRVPTHPMHVPGLDAAVPLASELVPLEVTDTLTVAANKVSAIKKL